MSGLFKILIVDDEADYRETYRMLLTQKGYSIEAAGSGEEALAILEKEYFPLVITDVLMPGISGIDFLRKAKEIYGNGVEVIMVTGYGSIETAVQTMRMGAFGYFIKSHDPEELVLEIQKAKRMLSLRSINVQNQGKQDGLFLLSSKNKEMQALWQVISQVADSNANILITGESGVGKEIVAKQIHEQSGRKKLPFVPLNCRQYPEALIESELFGHEKGAFTGAVNRRVGKLEEAGGGTIFLDEIGEMDMGTQVKLLRALETKELSRIGSGRMIPVDFRLVSATNKDIRKAVREGTFREDFLYRINTIELVLPPLRRRKEDIPAFLDFFIGLYAKETGKVIFGMEKATEDFLLRYNYPGNIRELKNIVERLVILSVDGMLQMKETELLSGLSESEEESKVVKKLEAEMKGEDVGAPLPYKLAKQNFEKLYIKEMLLRTNQNITKAAEQMGMSRRQLFNKIVEYGLGDSENNC